MSRRRVWRHVSARENRMTLVASLSNRPRHPRSRLNRRHFFLDGKQKTVLFAQFDWVTALFAPDSVLTRGAGFLPNRRGGFERLSRRQCLVGGAGNSGSAGRKTSPALRFLSSHA